MIKATINFKIIHWNLRKLKKQLLPHVKICAVVKANAYGLGDVVVAREVEAEVDNFAVASINEAVRLREGGIKKPILLLGQCQNFESVVRYNIIVSIHSAQEIRALVKTLERMRATCKIHIKVNTGMNRYGLCSVWQLKNILAIAKKSDGVIVDGLYTHMAYETDQAKEIDTQLKRFSPFRSVMRTHFPKAIIHAACSGSAEYLPAQFDMVRIGKTMYGGFDGYRTAIKITSKICAVQNIPIGARIGYNGTAAATHPMVIGVVPCGYADLAHYNFGNRHSVLVDNKLCKIIGRICMDSFMIDVTDIKSPLAKNVTILADQKGLSLMEVCRSINIIACNLLCSMQFNRAEVVYKY